MGIYSIRIGLNCCGYLGDPTGKVYPSGYGYRKIFLPVTAAPVKVAWGFIIRDDQGEGIAAGAGALSHLHEPMCAEAEACLNALKIATQLGISRMIIESDSAALVQALKTCDMDYALGGLRFREARNLINLDFLDVSIQHCKRSCNLCAHELARLGLNGDPNQLSVWVDPLPQFVRNLCARDLAEQII
uniref:RNase H type-1 domain-containing protein n=1 Tax=Oryza brachyantha TaxID=4533 RepID=J3LH35_ORYBR